MFCGLGRLVGMELVLWLVVAAIAGAGILSGTLALIALTKAPWTADE